MLLFFVGPIAACGPKYPNCKEDKDCKDKEYCVQGLCQQCRGDADCQQGEQCNGGRCDPIDGYCTSQSDCPAGQECRNNRCIAQASDDTNMSGDEDLTSSVDPGPCGLQAVFFEFDSDALDEQSRNQLQAYSTCVKDKAVSVHLTGHCDPRGTEEYNLALGDRRARSVKQYLQTLGVNDSKMTTSSMGEELSHPDDPGAWDKDRKVEFASK